MLTSWLSAQARPWDARPALTSSVEMSLIASIRPDTTDSVSFDEPASDMPSMSGAEDVPTRL